MYALSRLLPALLALLLLAGAASAVPVGNYVQDDAEMFGATAVQEANARISELQEKTHMAVWVRTLKEVPADVLQAQLKLKGTNREVLAFQGFAEELAKKEDRKGVIILISNDQRYQRAVVVVYPKELDSQFREYDCEQVRRILASRQFAKQPNKTLLDAIEKVQYQVLNRSEATTISWPLIGAVIAALLGLWLLLGILRSRLAQGDNGNNNDPQARKNSQVAGLLGGMFGAVAGHWIYDALFDHKKEQQQPPAEVTPGQNPLDEKIELSEAEKKTAEGQKSS
jgi:hypothetical protein